MEPYILGAGARKSRGGFSLLDNCVLLLDVATIEGIGDHEKIPIWEDQSGNDHHATQEVEGDQPWYETNELNGGPVVRFHGPYGQHMDVTLTTGLDNFSIFFVIKYPVGTAPFYTGWGPGMNDPSIGYGSGGCHGFYDGGYLKCADLVVDNNWNIISGWRNENGYYFSRNGIQSANNPMACEWSTTPTGITIPGDLGQHFTPEIIIHSPGLSDAHRGIVEAYLNDKYAIY